MITSPSFKFAPVMMSFLSTTPTAKPTMSAAPTVPTFDTNATATPTTKPLPNAPTYDSTSWDDTTKGQNALTGYNDAKEAVNSYGDFNYADYVMGESAQSAKDALDAHNANKPGEYQSQWQTQLADLMGQIMNRDKFSYDLNGDALYQQYKDKYIQQGKLAMGDAIGQASAMTGGYGNSYAQSVGQQQYQAQLDNLNDIVPELYQMALDRYKMEGQDLYNQYGMVMDRENQDYGRYRDTVSDWVADRGYLQGVYNDERGFDYGKYIDDRNLDYTLHQEGYQKLLDSLGIAKDDYYSGADMFHSEQSNKNNIAGQQFNDAMSIWGAENDQAWKEYQATEEQRQYANSLLQQGYQNEFGELEANTNQAWQQAQWDEGIRQSELEQYWREKEYEDSLTSYTGNDQKSDNIDNTEDDEPPVLTENKGWSDHNTETLEQNQAEKGGSYYSTAKGDIDDMIKRGKSYNDLMNYVQEMVGNSYISKSEYMTLVQYIRKKLYG